jgi:hypothetical protein
MKANKLIEVNTLLVALFLIAMMGLLIGCGNPNEATISHEVVTPVSGPTPSPTPKPPVNKTLECAYWAQGYKAGCQALFSKLEREDQREMPTVCNVVPKCSL